MKYVIGKTLSPKIKGVCLKHRGTDKYQRMQKKYLKVSFDKYGNDEMAEPHIFKAQEAIDGIELWYSLVNNYEIKEEKLDTAFDDHKFQLCCHKDYRSERHRILGTFFSE